MRPRFAAVGLALFALVAGSTGWAQDAPPPEDGAPEGSLVSVTPAELARQIPARLSTELFDTVVPVEEASPGVRALRAVEWLDELFAPWSAPACAALFGAPPSSQAWKDVFSPHDPATSASPDAPLLVPDTLPPLTDDVLEVLNAKGLLPIEITMGGEWARAVARDHAGPAPSDPLLRQARAIRLEGVARLAGMLLSLTASGVDPRGLGPLLIRADADEAGWPRGALEAGAKDDLSRAFLRAFTEDGLRWAAYHYLKGGVADLIAGLERPAVSPYDLVRPGLRREAPDLGEGGCRLGPRPTAVLAGGGSDPGWLAQVVADRWSGDTERGVTARIAFTAKGALVEAASDARAFGFEVEEDEERLILRLRRVPEEASTGP
jgi:hypothetical protein